MWLEYTYSKNDELIAWHSHRDKAAYKIHIQIHYHVKIIKTYMNALQS